MYFKTVIIVGSGTIACECSKILCNFNVQHLVMENNPTSISILIEQCQRLHIPLIERNNLSIEKALLNYAKDRTLIISANNEHIFKQELFGDNITIINFHYGLLPDYRGVNIPTWAIFNREKFTGVTWHYVDEKVDNGNIICQSRYEIREFDTALDITRAAMYKGAALFRDFIGAFLVTPDKGTGNDHSLCRHEYRKTDLPSGGVILKDMDAELIERLLRAFDYGSVEYIPKIKYREDKKEQPVLRYRIYKKGKLVLGNRNWQPDTIIIKDNYHFELKLETQK